MSTRTTQVAATATITRRVRATHFVVAEDVRELSPAEQWARALAGDTLARAALLARIMPQPSR